METLREIHREADWSSGDYPCIGCGKVNHIWYNGGELDRVKCACGLVYQTEHVQIDLVVYKAGE